MARTKNWISSGTLLVKRNVGRVSIGKYAISKWSNGASIIVLGILWIRGAEAVFINSPDGIKMPCPVFLVIIFCQIVLRGRLSRLDKTHKNPYPLSMNTARLLALANHLRSEPLGVEWDFGQFFTFQEFKYKPCGCAIGECAFLFPETNLAKALRDIKLHDNRSTMDIYELMRARACALFKISHATFDYLFIPLTEREQRDAHYLWGDSSPADVAAHIEDFIKEGKFRRRTDRELEEADV
jgi:hypothetical protein